MSFRFFYAITTGVLLTETARELAICTACTFDYSLLWFAESPLPHPPQEKILITFDLDVMNLWC